MVSFNGYNSDIILIIKCYNPLAKTINILRVISLLSMEPGHYRLDQTVPVWSMGFFEINVGFKRECCLFKISRSLSVIFEKSGRTDMGL